MGSGVTERPSAAVEAKRRSFLADFFVRLVKEKPLGAVMGVVTLLLLFTGLFAGSIAPYGMNEVQMGKFLTPPSAGFPLGTDNLGRDMLSRIIFGARISVIVGLAASALATVISLIMGMLTGYMGGKIDMVMQRFVDVVLSFPALLLMMVLVAVFGTGMWAVIIAMALRNGITGSRIIRSAVIGIKENMYAQAARAIGCSTSRVLIRHILPNIMAPAIVLFTTRVPSMILTEASLSFLGFGIPPPFPSWGGMLSGSGREYMFMAPWMAIWPGLALCITVYCVNMFGDAVRDILDPKLRGGAGRYGSAAQRKATAESEAAGAQESSGARTT
jgi:peptide/nickel transport system permease protein